MTDQEMDFAGQSVIVTGAGSGIGRSAARAFAMRGARVLAVGRRPEPLAETADGHPTIHPLAVDVTAADGPERIVTAAVETGGRIDVLVNNAGVVGRTPLGSITRAEVRRQLETNLVAPMFLTQEALPSLEASKGAVINVSTAVGQRGWPGMSVYGASKAGLDFLSRAWAVELASRGVRAVTVAPGPTDTPVLTNNGYSEADLAQVQAENDARFAGRVNTADEVAWWIVAVAHRRNGAGVNGAWLPVDGGGSVT
ncbi:NAD(P)-dependent dehydrogenase (short-subunit alcohol dehydrogenase family) [Actinoalloteichus hoggarensis]|uniref:3-oxoacyl-[acyl-carrier-protein] reductase FabG n=1 Tax=Actinoalloteichus hoggarensis TaxID=1470176 RepID=A0A221W0S5_9PSEU|nr:SDR family oxidoreductase [Actinoalloteichus hoggarensis]ASO19360.1 3-oxoacyl-[acyl-carrier-protein] reductase FabG [Actinoalloteichus hoggarensis]MBB5920598.1 NAD(P)-dependent dehydrogenase (short-subunit alcohol dehydrogenase family) [Actinoalloteichus hoggarensis]